MVGKLIREGSSGIKERFEMLLRGETIRTPIDEQIVYNQLGRNEKAVWSLLLASGYLKVLSYEKYVDIPEGVVPKYELALTNREVKLMFQSMVIDWFSEVEEDYNDFVKALLLGNVKAMNAYMNRESGFGRYDVMLEPRNPKEDDAIILEFKVHDPEDEATLKDTVQEALRQIEEKQYAAQLIARGIPEEHIRRYGFAFQGKKILIG